MYDACGVGFGLLIAFQRMHQVQWCEDSICIPIFISFLPSSMPYLNNLRKQHIGGEESNIKTCRILLKGPKYRSTIIKSDPSA